MTAEALGYGVWTRFQKWVLVLASLAFAVDGLANQVLGIAIPDLIRDWGTPREGFAGVRALGLVGVAVGATAGGALGDRFGRRAGLTGACLVFGAATMAGALAHGPGGLLWPQAVAGLGIGAALPNGAALIAEFTPVRRRTWALALGMTFIPVGGVLAGAVGALALVPWGWKGVFLIGGAAPLLAAAVLAIFLPPSPGVRIGAAAAGPERTSFAALLGPVVLRDTLALWAAFFFCLLASYTMFSWAPAMLRQKGFALAATSQGSLLFSIGGVLGGLLGGWLIQAAGSRSAAPILALGGVAGALALGLGRYGPADGIGPIGAALFVEGLFVAALNTAVYTLAAHVYPPHVRATGVGAAAGVGRLGAVVSAYTGAYSLSLWGPAGYFIVIAAAIAVTLAALLLARNQIPRAAAAG